jgi:hypothetical protein
MAVDTSTFPTDAAVKRTNDGLSASSTTRYLRSVFWHP